MDTSETYIKMCAKAEKIQQGWGLFDGDFIYYTDVWKQFSGVSVYPAINQFRSTYIWLPRQDQLQEMLKVKGVPIPSVAWVGYLLCLLQYDVGLKCTSMEQLWLAFVMRERFGKVWNGETWVKEGGD